MKQTGKDTDAYPVQKTEAEWRQELSPEQFRIMFEHATERPGTSALLQEKRPGTFVCAACGQPAYAADTKYESGSGWPSFWEPIEDATATTTESIPVHDPHGGALHQMRRPSGPRVRRRPGADRPALLHQRIGAEVQAQRVGSIRRHSLPRAGGGDVVLRP